MKKKGLILTIICAVIIAAVAACVFIFLLRDKKDGNITDTEIPDEGDVSMTGTVNWIDTKDHTEHTAATYTLGNSARKIEDELPTGFAIDHLCIDDVFLYEVYQKDISHPPLLFFLHGQSSRKEEFLPEMISYAEVGYFCVALDLQGHGERISEETLMALEITENTASDIDLLLDYYDAVGKADTGRFALIGFSQGGSVSYCYAAYGERTPSALVVGSTTPDLTYAFDDKCVCNGKSVEPIWSEDEIKEFVEKNNPIDHADRMMSLPILSGNSIDDEVISYKGSESLEKILKQGGNNDIRFYYYDGTGHDLSEEFIEKILPFLQEYV